MRGLTTAFGVQHSEGAQRALSILTIVTYLTLPLGSGSYEQQLVPTLPRTSSCAGTPPKPSSSRPPRNATGSRGTSTTGWAIDGVLRDLARTNDVATARWTAKILEYPVDHLDLTGEAWPWTRTLRPLGLAFPGVLVALGAFRVRARRTSDVAPPRELVAA